MVRRKPQINFQVEPGLKRLYDEAKLSGYRPARLCAAGLLLMVEDAAARQRALERLRAREKELASAPPRAVQAPVRAALRKAVER